MRWKQTNELGFLPNARTPDSYLGVTLDLFGKVGDPHEKAKQPVARRMIPGKYSEFSTPLFYLASLKRQLPNQLHELRSPILTRRPFNQ